MNIIEKNLVRLVAKLAPWLAPFPSAYFVARSAMAHLALPLPVAIIVALILETLGLSSTHLALWLSDWNLNKRKTDPQAPIAIAVALGGVYLVSTIGLVVVLEVWPDLATYAPAIFPLLAVVGAVNLSLMAGQEHREKAVQIERAERKAERQAGRQTDRPKETSRPSSQVSKPASNNGDSSAKLDILQRGRLSKRDARLDSLVAFFLDNPDAGPTRASETVGISRQTVYAYLDQLESAGRIARNNGTVRVLDAGRS